MAVLTEDLSRTAHYIVREANGYRSREQIVIASGAGKLKPGTVLGRITASKKYVQWASGASDGSQVAAAILYHPVDATAADVKATITARDTEVQANVLIWPDGTGDSAKNTQLAALASPAGIIAR